MLESELIAQQVVHANEVTFRSPQFANKVSFLAGLRSRLNRRPNSAVESYVPVREARRLRERVYLPW
jgi:hypothetical protein